jgi:L-ribulokinase
VLVDADLRGLLVGMTLATRAPEIYRALIEATAFGTRVIVEAFEHAGLRVDTIVACGGLPDRNPLLMQIFADVAGRDIAVAASHQAPALGAAMWGAVAAGAAAGGHATIADASSRMARLSGTRFVPRPDHREPYDVLYDEYRRLHDFFGRGGDDVMRRLKRLRNAAADADPVPFTQS